jgi:hypothetical protein
VNAERIAVLEPVAISDWTVTSHRENENTPKSAYLAATVQTFGTDVSDSAEIRGRNLWGPVVESSFASGRLRQPGEAMLLHTPSMPIRCYAVIEPYHFTSSWCR